MLKKRNLYGFLFAMVILFVVSLIMIKATTGTELVFFFYFSAFLSFYFMFYFSREIKLAKLPALTSKVILIEKIKEDHRSSSIYYLSFELEDGKRKLFNVKRETYTKFLQDEKGIITYKEDDTLIELISFKKNEVESKKLNVIYYLNIYS